MVDVGTRYGERVLTGARSTDEIRKGLEMHWLYRHGAQKRLSAHHEFFRPVIRKYLDIHDIALNARPSLSSNKCGRVERTTACSKRQ